MKTRPVLFLPCIIAFILAIQAAPFLCSAQQFEGFSYDNYSGVIGVLQNPGNIAASKYKVQVNILSLSAGAANNGYEIDRSRLFRLAFNNMKEDQGYYKAPNSDRKYAWANTDILGPSFMASLSPRSALGLITRMRVMGNENNLSNAGFQLISNSNPAFDNIDISERNANVKMHAFAEAGLTYGLVLFKDDTRTLKAGITGKYIAGLGFASLSSGHLLVNVDPLNNINKLNGDARVEYSPNLDKLQNGNFSDVFSKQASKGGWGLDLGVVYEWRPAAKGGSGSGTGWLKADPTPYALKMSLALTDIGAVRYKNSPNGQLYSVNGAGFNSSVLQKQDNEDFQQYFTRLQTQGILSAQSRRNDLQVKLPTAARADLDWHAYGRIFVNVDALVTLVGSSNTLSANYVTRFSVTPRLEKKWFSLYSPLSYNLQNRFAWGVGFRAGPIFAGSGSLLSNLFEKRVSAADFHIGLTVPIFQARKKPVKTVSADTLQTAPPVTVVKQVLITKDRDGDGVTDDRDECPDSAGIVALNGCPDRDGDGIPDFKDKCPDVKGSPDYAGCPIPDSDGDGVNDQEDHCPHTPGIASNNGCPAIKQEIVKKVDMAARSIYFVTGRDVLQTASYHELDMVAIILQSDTGLQLFIEGHTDDVGTEEHNQTLSEKRARAVSNYLVARGIPMDRLHAKGFGASRPVADNNIPAGKAKNRRVEMHLSN